jgi:NAD+ synthetase
MATLYAFAGNKKLLVAGTGNKVEDFGVGFFTKYGDGGVDLSPIADLMKSEVKSLAKELGGINENLHPNQPQGPQIYFHKQPEPNAKRGLCDTSVERCGCQALGQSRSHLSWH